MTTSDTTQAAPACVHHWIVERAESSRNGHVRGQCKKCGAGKQFTNDPYGRDNLGGDMVLFNPSTGLTGSHHIIPTEAEVKQRQETRTENSKLSRRGELLRRKSRAREMYAANWTPAEIAAFLGVAERTVYGYLGMSYNGLTKQGRGRKGKNPKPDRL